MAQAIDVFVLLVGVVLFLCFLAWSDMCRKLKQGADLQRAVSLEARKKGKKEEGP